MDLRRFDDWCRFCDEAANRPRDELIAGGGWMVSGSTPPPSLGHPLARLPLERADDCVHQFQNAASAAQREELLRGALRWLTRPHPESGPEVRTSMDRRRQHIEQLLQSSRSA